MNSSACEAVTQENSDQFSDEVNNELCHSKPIDLVHLSRQTFGSKELENEVLNLFISHSRQCLIRLENAQTDKEWSDVMHTIKGSARGVGAWKAGDCAEIYEKQVDQLSEVEKKEAFSKIKDEIETTIEYIGGLI